MPLKTTPLSDTFGVEVHDFDLKNVTEGPVFAQIRAAFEEHSALLFRGQDLDPETHIRLARLFGPIEDRNSDTLTPKGAYKVPEVTNVMEDGTITGEMDLHTLNLKSNMLWHADSTFLPVPALINILTAKIATTTGGATELASTRAAFADMAQDKQEALRGMVIRHKYSHSRARISEELAKLPMFNKWPDTRWPAVWKNPVNGKEAVYVASHSFAVEGMGEAEGQAYIDALIAECTQPKYVYSHQWSVGDVLMWDQRAVLHRGTPWPYDQPRKLASICVSATDADGLATMRNP
jgi:alpha-ketoglutarate-dependent 2,4-dichlorophenoxyacetate dioxygenase